MSNLPTLNTTAHPFASLYPSPSTSRRSSTLPLPPLHLRKLELHLRDSDLGPKNPILQGKITNLKSWAVYLLPAKCKLEDGKYTASERGTDFRVELFYERGSSLFCGVRNYQQITSQIFWASSGVRTMSVWRPDLFGRVRRVESPRQPGS